jgi:hypothetical protein
MMHRTTAPTDVVNRKQRWLDSVAAAGFTLVCLQLASCAETNETPVEGAELGEPAPQIDTTIEAEPDCGSTPINLTTEVDGRDGDCSYSAPITLSASGAGELRVMPDDIGTCEISGVANATPTDPMKLASGDMVRVGDDGDQVCRFRFRWTPGGEEATVSPTTTTTTTTTTMPPPTTTSAVGS